MPYQSLQNSWGLSHEALYTIYKGAIRPLLLLRCAGMDRGTGEGMQQNSIQQYSALLT